MDFLRGAFDIFYNKIKPIIFRTTQTDPETAHKIFSFFCQTLYRTRLDKLILDNSANYNDNQPLIPLSCAAGLNKNAQIPPTVLKYLGFDRVVVGTVTADYFEGNKRPRVIRYPETESLVNWMGLPGIGCKQVSERLKRYGEHNVPLTINLMATPGKKDDEALKDISKTIQETQDIPYVDRFELNISCPNTHSLEGRLDARRENVRLAKKMIEIVLEQKRDSQELYLKVSPDLDKETIDMLYEETSPHVNGYTTTNTTTQYNHEFLNPIPEKGGASGNALYDLSLSLQKEFQKRINESGNQDRLSVIACGGINSRFRLLSRYSSGAKEAQIYTGFIFKGPGLLRELRQKQNPEYEKLRERG